MRFFSVGVALGASLFLTGLLVYAAPVAQTEEDVAVETVATGLEVPWALAFTPDGRLLVTERPGRIRVIEPIGGLQSEPWAAVAVAHVVEAGLMGIAADPDFADNGHVYVCYTARIGSGTENRVARLTEVAGRGQDLTVILSGMPAAGNHNGCRLKFGPDGKLYVTMGDAGASNNAQETASLSGKVLRMETDGSVPADNPFPGSFVYTLGHRNPQGLDFHPDTGAAYITEHGPSDNDEINILTPGGNYGWPVEKGIANRAGFVDPIAAYTPTLAVAGGTFYSGGPLPEAWTGNFFFTTLKAQHIRRLTFDPDDQAKVTGQEVLFDEEYGRLRDIIQGPDGLLYFTTSNRDGRGNPEFGDDRVLRVAPLTLPEDGTPAPTPTATPPSVGGANFGTFAAILGIAGAGVLVFAGALWMRRGRPQRP